MFVILKYFMEKVEKENTTEIKRRGIDSHSSLFDSQGKLEAKKKNGIFSRKTFFLL